LLRAARGQRHVLQGREIVLALGVGQAEGRVGVGASQHVRHAPFVTADADVIELGLGQDGLPVGRLGQAGSIDHDQGRGGQHDQRQQRADPAQDPLHHGCFPPGLAGHSVRYRRSCAQSRAAR
jgi:hypothetical protein